MGAPALTLKKAGIMLPELLQHVSLFSVLHQIDKDFAEHYRQSGCPYCHGKLCYAPYYRKPRGGPEDIPQEYTLRLSLCCSKEGCRRRVLPPSCLFMGRNVYWRAVILIVVTLRQGKPQRRSINKLQEMFSISRKTIVRWIHYFRKVFPKSSQWQRLRGRLSARVGNDNLPGRLLTYFFSYYSSISEGLIGCLRFLASGHKQ